MFVHLNQKDKVYQKRWINLIYYYHKIIANHSIFVIIFLLVIIEF
ncbi:hypothetical protein AO372_0519 [Moraxella catarrhalis]|nr:hypothetical protein AO372_0519 [Moraxella catarrhalis]